MYCICQRVTALKKLSTSLIQELVYIMEYDLVHYEIRIDNILKTFSILQILYATDHQMIVLLFQQIVK